MDKYPYCVDNLLFVGITRAVFAFFLGIFWPVFHKSFTFLVSEREIHEKVSVILFYPQPSVYKLGWFVNG